MSMDATRANVERWLFPTCVTVALVVVGAIYIVSPWLSLSQRLVEEDQAAVRTEVKLRELRERHADGEESLKDAIAELDQLSTEQRDALRARGFVASYWAKMAHRDLSEADMVGVWTVYAILAVFFSTGLYLLGMMHLHLFPGARRADADVETLFRERWQHVLACWQRRQDLGVVRSENDAATVAVEQSVAVALVPVRWAIWIMPVLGFIGTVVGISSAIGGLQVGVRLVFAENNISAEALSFFNDGFRGLGFAFDTTFFGLIGLATIGTGDFFIRRRVASVLRQVDERVAQLIPDQLPVAVGGDDKLDVEKLHGLIDAQRQWLEDWEAISEAGRELYEWFEQTGRPGWEGELEQSELFRRWVRDELLPAIEKLAEEHAEATVEAVERSAQGLGERINTYGELLVRLAAAQRNEAGWLRRAALFMVAALYEAAQERDSDPFWRRLVAALERPVNTTESARLLQEPIDSSRVEAIAVSSTPFRVAVAIRADDIDETSVRIFSLDSTQEGSVVFHPMGRNEADAAVDALHFDRRGARVAYVLSDGTLGVYELSSGRTDQIVLSGVAARRGCLAWWSHGRESLIVPLVEGAGEARLAVFPFLGGVTRDDRCGRRGGLASEASQTLPLADLDVRSVLAAPGRRVLCVAGQHPGRGPAVWLFHEELGIFSDPREVSLGDARAQLVSASLGLGGECVFLALADGRLFRLSLAPDAAPERIVDLEGSATALTAVDAGVRFFVSATLDDNELRVRDLGDGAGGRRIDANAPIACAAVSPDCQIVVVGGRDGSASFWEFPVHLV